MLTTLKVVLRTPRLWPAAALIVLALVGLGWNAAPTTATGSTDPATQAAAAPATAGQGPSSRDGSTTHRQDTEVEDTVRSYPAQVDEQATNPGSEPYQAPTGLTVIPDDLRPAPAAPAYNPRPPQPAPAAPAEDPAVRALIAAQFPADQVEAAVAVSVCASGQRPAVTEPGADGTRGHGLFALNDGGTLQRLLTAQGLPATDLGAALDPTVNIRAAAQLYREQGWAAFPCAATLGLATAPAAPTP